MVRRGAVLSGAPSYDKIQNIGQVREKPETLSLNCLHNIVLLKIVVVPGVQLYLIMVLAWVQLAAYL